jgi:SAM-dependent methyltransferase
MRMFLDLFHPDPTERILDVGGSPDLWRAVGYEGPITFLNLDPRAPWGDMPSGWTYVQGDGCRLPFEAGEFGITFSNSVIEHVGDTAAQACFATEIRRTGRRYWVQTPDRLFPIEPHMNFPVFQWLPDPVAHAVVATWPLSFHRRDGLSTDDAWAAQARTRLLDVSDMRRLFPDAVIWRERALGLTKSIVAYRA